MGQGVGGSQFMGQSLGSLGAPLFASFTPGNLALVGCVAFMVLSLHQAPNKALFSILGKSNLHFAGMSIAVNISVDGLNLMIPTTRQVRDVPRNMAAPLPSPLPPMPTWGTGSPHAKFPWAVSPPQIIANHHMQSISFASGGDTVRHRPQGQWGQGLPFIRLSNRRAAWSWDRMWGWGQA